MAALSPTAQLTEFLFDLNFHWQDPSRLSRNSQHCPVSKLAALREYPASKLLNQEQKKTVCVRIVFSQKRPIADTSHEFR